MGEDSGSEKTQEKLFLKAEKLKKIREKEKDKVR